VPAVIRQPVMMPDVMERGEYLQVQRPRFSENLLRKKTEDQKEKHHGDELPECGKRMFPLE